VSFAAAHESKRVHQVCQNCRDRKARFQYRGAVRADRDHTLCFECYRSEVNRQRAQRLAAVSTAPLRATSEPKSPFEIAQLSERQIAHRQRMLLAAVRHRAG
jgi:hypothetical protein